MFRYSEKKVESRKSDCCLIHNSEHVSGVAAAEVERPAAVEAVEAAGKRPFGTVEPQDSIQDAAAAAAVVVVVAAAAGHERRLVLALEPEPAVAHMLAVVAVEWHTLEQHRQAQVTGSYPAFVAAAAAFAFEGVVAVAVAAAARLLEPFAAGEHHLA